MPILIRSTAFRKKFNALSSRVQKQIEIRLELFLTDEFNQLLNNHVLHGAYEGCRSINITGDIRLIYKELKAKAYLLVIVGTHHQLFGK